MQGLAIYFLPLSMWLFCLPGKFESRLSRTSGFEIYNVEQLDDIMLKADGSGEVALNVVLIIFEPSCAEIFGELGKEITVLPLEKYVTLLLYDHLTSIENTWYTYYGKGIRSRYNVSNCSEVLYIRKGSKKYDPPIKWRQGEDPPFINWVWNHIRVPTIITNLHAYAIAVDVIPGINSEAKGSNRLYMDPGGETVVIVPLSYIVVAHRRQDKGQMNFIGAWIVLKAGTTVEITGELKHNTEMENYVEHLMENDERENQFLKATIWNDCTRHLLNLKQPLIVNNFTGLGYLKVKIPADLYSALNEYYQRNRVNNREEKLPLVDNIINYGSTKTSILNLSPSLYKELNEKLLHYVEAWSKQKLVQTSIYGIREYHRGSILKKHVDRIETHVISAILQIDQDLGDSGEDWMLEVVDWDGQSRNMVLKPGEMVLYESAKLIHGRPHPFKGNRFANIFVHYKPVNGWQEYVYDYLNLSLRYPEGNIEHLLPLPSHITRLQRNKHSFHHTASRSKEEL